MKEKLASEFTFDQLMSGLTDVVKATYLPLREEINYLSDELNRLERKVINLEYKVSRISASIPTNQRLDVRNFTVVSNDEAKKLLENADRRSATTPTPTKGNHQRCHECNPGWDGSKED